jgi:hypothetical protein
VIPKPIPNPERKRWYSRNVDPRAEHLERECPQLLHNPTPSQPPNLVSSLCEDGLHRPALDIDVPCRVIKSKTPGHCHLYFDDTALTWDSYVILLAALANAGIIEHAYLSHSIRDKQTLLRIFPETKVEGSAYPELPDDEGPFPDDGDYTGSSVAWPPVDAASVDARATKFTKELRWGVEESDPVGDLRSAAEDYLKASGRPYTEGDITKVTEDILGFHWKDDDPV